MPSRPIDLLHLLLLALALAAALTVQGCAPAAVVGTAYGASVVHERRSPGTVLDDEVIELKAKHLYHQDRAIAEHSRIRVISYNYAVLLVGQADDAAVRRDFAELVRRIPKVERVYNEVQVGPRISLAQKSQDALITSRAKVALGDGRGVEDFDATRVKVVTEGGVVYLMGLVTREEADVTIDVVRRLPGVERVVTFFEYVQPQNNDQPRG